MENLNKHNINNNVNSSGNLETERKKISWKILWSLDNKMEDIFHYLKTWRIWKKFMESSKKVLDWEYIEDYDNILDDMRLYLYEKHWIMECDLVEGYTTSSEDCPCYPYPDILNWYESTFLLNWLRELNNFNSWKGFNANFIKWFYQNIDNKDSFVSNIKKYFQ